MSQTRSDAQPFPWGWYVAMVVSAAATGFAFAQSPPLGFVLAGVTVVIVGSFLVWAVRRGRRSRAAGHVPDLDKLRKRLAGRAKWLTVLAVLSAVSCGVALATSDGHAPAWLLIASPVLMFVAVGVTWLFLLVILPRLQRQQGTK